MRRFSLFALFWLAILSLFTHYAHCATLQVAPVMLNLTASQRAGALYLTNTGDQAIHAQIRVYDWTQSSGKDVLTLTNEIVSSPAVTSLAPGQRQLVRIVVLNPVAHPQEQSFRLLVDELPRDHLNALSQNGVHFLLRYSIPLFIAPLEPTKVDETAQLSCQQENQDVWCQNTGNSHIRMSNVQAIADNGQVIDTLSGLAGYVLPGKQFALPFKRSHRDSLSSLRAYLNEHTQASQLSVHPAAVVNRNAAPR